MGLKRRWGRCRVVAIFKGGPAAGDGVPECSHPYSILHNPVPTARSPRSPITTRVPSSRAPRVVTLNFVFRPSSRRPVSLQSLRRPLGSSWDEKLERRRPDKRVLDSPLDIPHLSRHGCKCLSPQPVPGEKRGVLMMRLALPFRHQIGFLSANCPVWRFPVPGSRRLCKRLLVPSSFTSACVSCRLPPPTEECPALTAAMS